MFSLALCLIIAGIVIIVKRSQFGGYPGAEPDEGPDIDEVCLHLPLVYLKTENGIDNLEHYVRTTAGIQVALYSRACLRYCPYAFLEIQFYPGPKLFQEFFWEGSESLS